MGSDSVIVSEETIEQREMTMTRRSGPLPDGEVMVLYKSVDPALPMAVFGMAQEEAQHRRQQEVKRLDAQILDAQENRDFRTRGQTCGMVVAIVFGAFALTAALLDHTWFAVVLGGGVIFSLVAVFVLGKVVRPAMPKGAMPPPQMVSAALGSN